MNIKIERIALQKMKYGIYDKVRKRVCALFIDADERDIALVALQENVIGKIRYTAQDSVYEEDKKQISRYIAKDIEEIND